MRCRRLVDQCHKISGIGSITKINALLWTEVKILSQSTKRTRLLEYPPIKKVSSDAASPYSSKPLCSASGNMFLRKVLIDYSCGRRF